MDETKDGWIDETDGEDKRLYIWTKDENGNDKLQGHKESGVGAIYTAAAETSFDLKNSDNTTNGRIKRTDLYISDNGSAGTIQQIDVAV